jgi:hypothetical protein
LQTKYKEEEDEPVASEIEPPKMKRIGGGFVPPPNLKKQETSHETRFNKNGGNMSTLSAKRA